MAIAETSPRRTTGPKSDELEAGSRLGQAPPLPAVRYPDVIIDQPRLIVEPDEAMEFMTRPLRHTARVTK